MTSSFELAYISNFFTYIVNCRKLVQQKKKPRRQEKTNNENDRRQNSTLTADNLELPPNKVRGFCIYIVKKSYYFIDIIC